MRNPMSSLIASIKIELREIAKAALFALVLVAVNSAFAGPPELPATGVVLELGTDKPIKDAWVVVNWTYYGSGPVDSRSACLAVAFAHTDSEGKYKLPNRPITLPWQEIKYETAVYATGYSPSSAFYYPASSTGPMDSGAQTRERIGRDVLRAQYRKNFLDEESKGILRAEVALDKRERFKGFSRVLSVASCYQGENKVNKDEIAISQDILIEAKSIAETKEDADWISLFQRINVDEPKSRLRSK